MPQLDFTTFIPQLFWLFISLSILYLMLSRIAFSIEAESVVEDLRVKLEEAKAQSQKNLMTERQKNLEEISLKRNEFEEKVSRDIESSEADISKSKESALMDISLVAEDLAEEMLNNLFVKKVEKKDLNKFSKTFN